MLPGASGVFQLRDSQQPRSLLPCFSGSRDARFSAGRPSSAVAVGDQGEHDEGEVERDEEDGGGVGRQAPALGVRAGAGPVVGAQAGMRTGAS